ncbi:MAG: hypothetical protein KDE03_06400 [Rhodobacteraceae bacterium]|nr:hypothetical protein [Paracoccaceae bacterium]
MSDGEPADENAPDKAEASATGSGNGSEVAPSPGAKAHPPRRGGGFPLLLGGGIAAGIGAAAMLYVGPKIWPPAPAIDVSPMAQEIADQSARIDAISGEVSKLSADAGLAGSAQAEAANTLANDIAGLKESLSGLDQRLASIEAAMSTLDARLAEVEKRPAADGSASATALEAFGREMDRLRAEIADQKAAAEKILADIARTGDAAAARISTAEAEAQQLREEAVAISQETARQTAISRIAAAMDSGSPLESSLADLAASGVEVPSALADQAQGVPTLAALRSAFPPAARQALQASLKSEAGDSTWNRLTAFIRSQSGARSLTPRAGDDPDAVLSRAEAALVAGDLPLALQELEGLPPAGRDAMAEWAGRVERRLAASAALADLTATINE